MPSDAHLISSTLSPASYAAIHAGVPSSLPASQPAACVSLLFNSTHDLLRIPTAPCSVCFLVIFSSVCSVQTSNASARYPAVGIPFEGTPLWICSDWCRTNLRQPLTVSNPYQTAAQSTCYDRRAKLCTASSEPAFVRSLDSLEYCRTLCWTEGFAGRRCLKHVGCR